VIIPAGVGHKCLHASEQFCVSEHIRKERIMTLTWEKNTELKSALKHIKNLSKPATDPVYGKLGFLTPFGNSI